jgi:hypothetical protein
MHHLTPVGQSTKDTKLEKKKDSIVGAQFIAPGFQGTDGRDKSRPYMAQSQDPENCHKKHK